MRPYQFLAKIYDCDWGDYILDYLPLLKWFNQTYGLNGKSVLDAACGTGNLSLILNTMGAQVTGFDLAPEMLQLARTKCNPEFSRFIVQDMRTFDLGAAQFDFVFNTFDSINYLLEPEEIAAFFARVQLALRPGGIFVFDINTIHAFGFQHLGTFPRRIDGVDFVQKHEFESERCLEKTWFIFDNGIELHCQRGYSKNQIDALLVAANFRIEQCLHAFKLIPADENTERLIYLAQKQAELT